MSVESETVLEIVESILLELVRRVSEREDFKELDIDYYGFGLELEEPESKGTRTVQDRSDGDGSSAR